MKQTLKEWSGARSRIEVEVKRKMEHINSATKFAESRAFHRYNHKTKNFKPENNPLLESTSSSDGDDEAQIMPSNAKHKNSGHDPVVILGRDSVLSPTRKTTEY